MAKSCKVELKMEKFWQFEFNFSFKLVVMIGIKFIFRCAMYILISGITSSGLLKIMLDIVYGIGFGQHDIIKNSFAEYWQPDYNDYKWWKGITVG